MKNYLQYLLTLAVINVIHSPSALAAPVKKHHKPAKPLPTLNAYHVARQRMPTIDFVMQRYEKVEGGCIANQGDEIGKTIGFNIHPYVRTCLQFDDQISYGSFRIDRNSTVVYDYHYTVFDNMDCQGGSKYLYENHRVRHPDSVVQTEYDNILRGGYRRVGSAPDMCLSDYPPDVNPGSPDWHPIIGDRKILSLMVYAYCQKTNAECSAQLFKVKLGVMREYEGDERGPDGEIDHHAIDNNDMSVSDHHHGEIIQHQVENEDVSIVAEQKINYIHVQGFQEDVDIANAKLAKIYADRDKEADLREIAAAQRHKAINAADVSFEGMGNDKGTNVHGNMPLQKIYEVMEAAGIHEDANFPKEDKVPYGVGH